MFKRKKLTEKEQEKLEKLKKKREEIEQKNEFYSNIGKYRNIKTGKLHQHQICMKH